MEGRQMTDRWRGNSNVFMMDVPRWPPEPADDPPPDSPEVEQLTPRERHKRAISRAWLTSTAQPRYWEMPVVDPMAQVVVPAASNPAKGSGPTLVEIERHRAAEQAAFVERLRQRWINNLSHL
jgi:hypothetical protein